MLGEAAAEEVGVPLRHLPSGDLLLELLWPGEPGGEGVALEPGDRGALGADIEVAGLRDAVAGYAVEPGTAAWARRWSR